MQWSCMTCYCIYEILGHFLCISCSIYIYIYFITNKLIKFERWRSKPMRSFWKWNKIPIEIMNDQLKDKILAQCLRERYSLQLTRNGDSHDLLFVVESAKWFLCTMNIENVFSWSTFYDTWYNNVVFTPIIVIDISKFVFRVLTVALYCFFD